MLLTAAVCALSDLYGCVCLTLWSLGKYAVIQLFGGTYQGKRVGILLGFYTLRWTSPSLMAICITRTDILQTLQ